MDCEKKWAIRFEKAPDGASLLEVRTGPLMWTISIYYFYVAAGRASLMWLSPWAWEGIDWRRCWKQYLWSYLPDDEHIWGRFLGWEYCYHLRTYD